MIYGKVENGATSRGIDHARVSVNLGLEIRTTATDSSGNFSLPNLPEGIDIPVAIEKRGFRKAVIAVTVISGKSTPVTISLSNTYLELLSFNSGRYIAGTDQEIRWEAGETGKIRIEFSPNGGCTWLLLVENADSHLGRWIWSVPDIPTMNGLIRITSSDRLELTDQSDQPFSITSI